MESFQFNMERFRIVKIHGKEYRVDLSDTALATLTEKGAKLAESLKNAGDTQAIGQLKGELEPLFNTVFADKPFDRIYEDSGQSSVVCAMLLLELVRWMNEQLRPQGK